MAASSSHHVSSSLKPKVFHAALVKFLRAWFDNRWLCWGVGPMLALLFGTLLPAAALEFAISKKWLMQKGIEYQKDGGQTRAEMISKTREIVPFRKQLTGAFWTVLGPPAGLNILLMGWLFPKIMGHPKRLLPDVKSFLASFLGMYLISDLGLYWGHRVQHEVPWLWENCHKVHHTLETPTPMGTMYIDHTDAMLQVGLPMMAAVCLVRPHPVTFYALVWAGNLEHILNHCGLDDKTCTNILSWRWLPLRGSISHHDYHHKFCGRAGNVRNFGEGLWLWDWMFGTLAKAKVRAHSAAIP